MQLRSCAVFRLQAIAGDSSFSQKPRIASSFCWTFGLRISRFRVLERSEVAVADEITLLNGDFRVYRRAPGDTVFDPYSPLSEGVIGA